LQDFGDISDQRVAFDLQPTASEDTMMSDVLRSFDEPIGHSSGRYHARVIGKRATDGMWEGWLEFTPLDSALDVVASSVESRQATKPQLEYWALGLSVVYAEGSLDRAVRPLRVQSRIVDAPPPVLNPFEVGARDLSVLAQELHALNRTRLLQIIAAFDIRTGGTDAAMSNEQLIEAIVSCVVHQLVARSR
jgi:hypothetical protein